MQLATYHDHQRGLKMTFHYQGSGRLPRAVTIQGAQGQAVYRLGFDQVGSLKAVASQEADNGLRVVKLVDYDSFGNILSDSNPSLFLPLGFAGGLRDRFTGLVRFGHRDYDPTVGRFTAPDPMGDTGGDHDPYEYCVDEPVGRVDPEGLEDKGTDLPSPGKGDLTKESGVLSEVAGKAMDLWNTFSSFFTAEKESAAAHRDLEKVRDDFGKAVKKGDWEVLEGTPEKIGGVYKEHIPPMMSIAGKISSVKNTSFWQTRTAGSTPSTRTWPGSRRTLRTSMTKPALFPLVGVFRPSAQTLSTPIPRLFASL